MEKCVCGPNFNDIASKTKSRSVGHGQGHLTGADLKAQTKEIIGTCVSMRVKIDGHWANDALEIINKGEWDERFN